MADQNEVIKSFDSLLTKIDAIGEWFRQRGIKALNTGDYETAEKIISQAKKMATFRERIMELKVEWQKSFSQEVDETAADKKITSTLPKGSEPVQGLNIRTQEKEFRRPILEALEELGGAASHNEVLKRVYEKMKERLSEHDHQLLPGGGEVRWRNTARWCRKHMVKEGLLASDSPRGIWKITPAGRIELARLRKTEE